MNATIGEAHFAQTPLHSHSFTVAPWASCATANSSIVLRRRRRGKARHLLRGEPGMPRSSVAQQRPVSTGALTSSTVSQIQCRNSVDSGMNVHVHTCIDRQTFIHSFFHRPLRGCTNSFRPAFLKQPLVTHPIHTVHRPKLKGKPGSKRRRQGKNFEQSSGSEAKEIPTRGNRRGRRSRASVDRRLHRLNEMRSQRRRD